MAEVEPDLRFEFLHRRSRTFDHFWGWMGLLVTVPSGYQFVDFFWFYGRSGSWGTPFEAYQWAALTLALAVASGLWFMLGWVFAPRVVVVERFSVRTGTRTRLFEDTDPETVMAWCGAWGHEGPYAELRVELDRRWLAARERPKPGAALEQVRELVE